MVMTSEQREGFRRPSGQSAQNTQKPRSYASSACGWGGADEGTRTPNHLFTRQHIPGDRTGHERAGVNDQDSGGFWQHWLTLLDTQSDAHGG